MSNVAVILQILVITIGMIGLGMVLNMILGLRKEKMREFRQKALNIRERMKNAQAIGDVQMMLQLQRETMQFSKQMMMKQLVPLCLRCVVFIGIFTILSFIYGPYSTGLLPFQIPLLGSGWVALYFLFSIGISILIFGIKALYKKLTGKPIRSQNNLREIMQLISSSEPSTGSSFQLPPEYKARSETSYVDNEQTSEGSDSWKDRIRDKI
ncbi:MAG: hypothetical protein ACFFBI_13340 [Promethearchaeota archaeon]